MPVIKLLVDGGSMSPGPAVAQQLGPMGINMGKVIEDVNTATAEFKGMQVPVELDVNAETKEFTVTVKSPAVSALIKKELGIEKASGERLKTTIGNLAIEQVISITKQKQSNMLAKDFISALKSVMGSCMAAGSLIENKDPKEVLEEIESGKFKTEIEAQKTELDPVKKRKLDLHLKKVQAGQEAEKKAEEEEKAAAEAAKVAAAEAGEAGEPAEGEEGAEPAEGEEGAEPAEGEGEAPAETPAEKS